MAQEGSGIGEVLYYVSIQWTRVEDQAVLRWSTAPIALSQPVCSGCGNGAEHALKIPRRYQTFSAGHWAGISMGAVPISLESCSNPKVLPKAPSPLRAAMQGCDCVQFNIDSSYNSGAGRVPESVIRRINAHVNKEKNEG